MAGLRRRDTAPVSVREALIAKLSGHVRVTVDPRLYLAPEEEWPSPTPPYVDHIADLYDDLVAGKAVNVWAFLLRRGEAPPGCTLVRIDVDGSLRAASRVSDSPRHPRETHCAL